MVSSSRQAIACILLIFGTTFCSQAQTNPAKPATASISGNVTIKGKAAPGITVVAQAVNHRGPDRGRYQATTDSSGKYRIANVPEGNYQVHPYALAFVVENESASLMVVAGETVEDLNFALVPGGVITGKITDSDGQPLIEQLVNVSRIDGQQQAIGFHRSSVQTDDRGIYRAFGLRAGQYKVSAGYSPYRLFGNPRRSYTHTFHPSTNDAAKATVIEVSEGSEIRNVDIVVTGRPATGFKVAGRIIDGETGKPLSNIVYGLTQIHENGSTSMSGQRSNADGEFNFENVTPGKYAVYIQPPPDSGIRGNRVSFEVTDRDITGLTVKTAKGASLSGVVVLEGPEEKPLISKSGEFFIQAFVETSEPDYHDTSMPNLNPDGTFRITGLRGGTVQILVSSMNRSQSEFAIIRVERDGVAQPNNTINLKDGERVEGLRVVVNQFTGAIRGQVKIEDGDLPSSGWVSVSVTNLDDNAPTRSSRSEPVDARGRFHVDALRAGRYEVQVSVFVPGPQPRHFQSKKEQVTVTDNTVAEVVLTVRLNP